MAVGWLPDFVVRQIVGLPELVFGLKLLASLHPPSLGLLTLESPPVLPIVLFPVIRNARRRIIDEHKIEAAQPKPGIAGYTSPVRRRLSLRVAWVCCTAVGESALGWQSAVTVEKADTLRAKHFAVIIEMPGVVIGPVVFLNLLKPCGWALNGTFNLPDTLSAYTTKLNTDLFQSGAIESGEDCESFTFTQIPCAPLPKEVATNGLLAPAHFVV
jgi:hypothetical protein